MNYGAAAPAYRPTAWAYLPSGDCTIRWQRGDNVAYIFQGKQLETYPDQGLRVETLATIRYRLKAGLIYLTSSVSEKRGLRLIVSAARRAGCSRDCSPLT